MPEMNMPNINMRENYLKFLRHEETPMIPIFLASCASLGHGILPGPWIEGGPIGGGYDGFGVRWLAPESGGGAPMPSPMELVLEDIAEWREKVTIPDVDVIDWEAAAAADLANVDRSKQLVDYCVGNGVFMRLTALMGFEEALMSMAEEPEEVTALFTAITDYHIQMLDRVAKYYKPEVITYGDDVAAQRALLISPNTYRELIKPHHIRFVEACKSYGIIPVYHCCGHAEAIVEDMIEEGWNAWTSVQICNDISSLIEKYSDRLGFIGGYDTNGRPSSTDATDEEIIAEIHRSLDTYGKYGKGFAFFGYRSVNSLDFQVAAKATGFIITEAVKYAFQKM